MSKKKKQATFLEINLNNPARQALRRLGSPPKPLSDIIRVIGQAGDSKQVDGIILNVSSYEADRSTMWEIRKSLEKFKSKGKKLCAFISNADLDIYCLATVADKIMMDELGYLELLGYAYDKQYAKQGLDKLGIGVRELRYMEFKSAAELYTRDAMSDADKVQLNKLMEDVMATTRDTVCKARSITTEEFDTIVNNEFLFTAKSAFERKLVDHLGRKEAVKNIIKEMTGCSSDKDATFMLYGDYNSSLSGSKNTYTIKESICPMRPQIAIVNANGACDLKRGIKAWELASTIKELTARKQVKAIVMRVNSPGGSAEASDYVNEAIKAAKKKKPVVVSMGSVAASGGYWISMNANHICATPVTITGSIGVIASWLYDKGLNNKLGLNADSVRQGDHADLKVGVLLPKRDLNEEEVTRFKSQILDMYSEFKHRVSESRGIEIDQVESVAQGRVHSGLDAHKHGLVDSIGGLDDAIDIARELAKIPKKEKVIFEEFPKPKFMDRIKKRIMSAGTNNNAASLIIDLLLPEPLLTELGHRFEHNGQAMPILPLMFHIPND